MKIRMLRKKGSCPPGYIGEYSKDTAKRLIKLGYAEEYKEPRKVQKKVEKILINKDNKGD